MKAISVYSSSSSNTKSNHNSKNVKDLVQSFDKTTIKTCIIGIAGIGKEGFLKSQKTATHASLFLSENEANKFGKYAVGGDEIEGIIMEYGAYLPNGINNEEEREAVDNGYVIYRYGKTNGGLRYYRNTFSVFKKSFSDSIYMVLEVKKYDQISFSYLLDKIAPKDENKWISKNYKTFTFNCRNFVAHALNVIKPIYDPRNIEKGSNTQTRPEKAEKFIPKDILDVLEKFEE